MQHYAATQLSGLCTECNLYFLGEISHSILIDKLCALSAINSGVYSLHSELKNLNRKHIFSMMEEKVGEIFGPWTCIKGPF